MPKASYRYQLDASEAEDDAFRLVAAAFGRARYLEDLVTYGEDIYEGKRAANYQAVAEDSYDYDAAEAFLGQRLELATRRKGAPNQGGDVVGDEDAQGEQQILFDVEAYRAMQAVAERHLDLALLGEEDQFRVVAKLDPSLGPEEREAEGRRLEMEAARQRGQHLARLDEENRPFALVDPVDGSNQVAGMGNRSGWASCAMVRHAESPNIATAVLLGDGRLFVCDGAVVRKSDNEPHYASIWLSEAHHPDRVTPSHLLNPFGDWRHPFGRKHYVIPAAKRKMIDKVHRALAGDARRHGDDAIQWISPLAGNPGILAGMLGAGASGAMQPEAYAWDHMAIVMLAQAGFPTLRGSADEAIARDEIAQGMLEDMIFGRKTPAMFVGRTIDEAKRLQEAWLMTD